ncbi:PHP domain-containing protein [Chloroflexota bacterium]
MGRIDLHVHSNASDGRFSPEEIVQKAAALGLTALALADHDSVAGVAPAVRAATAFPGLTVIPNVEISTDTDDGEVHVLGYFIDHTDAGLNANLEGFRNSRLTRVRKMLARLNDLGMPVAWQRVRELAGDGSFGRPHVARAMLEKGYITSFREAFEKYIGYGGPAYVPREKMTPDEAIDLILRARGLPGLAHPFTMANVAAMVAKLKEAGLVALEAYYNGYTPGQRKTLVSLAQKYHLITTGGSDYHGLDDSTETMLGNAGVPAESVKRLIALAEQRGRKVATPQ